MKLKVGTLTTEAFPAAREIADITGYRHTCSLFWHGCIELHPTSFQTFQNHSRFPWKGHEKQPRPFNSYPVYLSVWKALNTSVKIQVLFSSEQIIQRIHLGTVADINSHVPALHNVYQPPGERHTHTQKQNKTERRIWEAVQNIQQWRLFQVDPWVCTRKPHLALTSDRVWIMTLANLQFVLHKCSGLRIHPRVTPRSRNKNAFITKRNIFHERAIESENLKVKSTLRRPQGPTMKLQGNSLYTFLRQIFPRWKSVETPKVFFLGAMEQTRRAQWSVSHPPLPKVSCQCLYKHACDPSLYRARITRWQLLHADIDPKNTLWVD